MPGLFQWLFCFCPIDSGQDVFYTYSLCNRVSEIGGKIKGFFHPQHPWCWCVWLLVRTLLWCVFATVGLIWVPELGRSLLGWCVSSPHPLLVWSWCVANMSECGDGKIEWVAGGAVGALKVCLAKAEFLCLLSIHPVLKGIWISLMPRLVYLLRPTAHDVLV